MFGSPSVTPPRGPGSTPFQDLLGEKVYFAMRKSRKEKMQRQIKALNRKAKAPQRQDEAPVESECTDEEIFELCVKAGFAGNHELVATCQRALAGDYDARSECSEAIVAGVL